MDTLAKTLTPAEQEFLLQLARETIAAFATASREPAVDGARITSSLREPRACFVTLSRRGELRGCIGNIRPREPLYRGVMENARGAAFRDSRFAPVGAGEVPGLEIEISVLSPPLPLEFASPRELLGKLHPNVDGVLLQIEGRTATFLPQVWRKIPDAVRFMDALAQKAGLPIDSWRNPAAVVMTYQVESFEAPGCG
jgi:AmmeMemoRadiSam system protein A